jgi:hypothetical protein
MEELQTIEVLDREILEDARKKAFKILKNAGDAVTASRDSWEKKLHQTLEKARTSYAQKAEQSREEIMARLPMDKQRIRSEKIEFFLEKAMKDFLESLDRPALIALLKQELALRIEEIRSGGGEATAAGELRYRFLEAAEVSALVQEALSGAALKLVEDPLYTIPGLFPAMVIDLPGLRLTASVDRAAEALLLDKRVELAVALLGDGVTNSEAIGDGSSSGNASGGIHD